MMFECKRIVKFGVLSGFFVYLILPGSLLAKDVSAGFYAGPLSAAVSVRKEVKPVPQEETETEPQAVNKKLSEPESAEDVLTDPAGPEDGK